MADVPDNAPERECLNKITGIVIFILFIRQ